MGSRSRFSGCSRNAGSRLPRSCWSPGSRRSSAASATTHHRPPQWRSTRGLAAALEGGRRREECGIAQAPQSRARTPAAGGQALPPACAPPDEGPRQGLRRPQVEGHGRQAGAPRARGARLAPAGSRAAEALENAHARRPAAAAGDQAEPDGRRAGSGPRLQLRRPRLRHLGRRPPAGQNGDVGPNYYIQTVNTSIGIYDKSTGTRVAAFTFNSLHEPGALREPLRHRQLRRPGRALRQLRGPLVHHRLRLQARRLGQRQPAAVPSSASPSRRPATRSTAAGTSTRSRRRAASATTRSSASGRTGSTCRPTCSATRRRRRTSATTSGR